MSRSQHDDEPVVPARDIDTTTADRAAQDGISRRALLATAAGAIGTTVLGSIVTGQQPMVRGQPGPATPPPPVAPPDPTKVPGLPSGPLGPRSPFAPPPSLLPTGVTTGPSFAPLQDLIGTITPSDLHFQRHHNGIPTIDPKRYELIVHGMVDHPTVFTLDDIKRFPAVTRVHFVECSGNGRVPYYTPKPDLTPQQIAGLTSNSEWTGVPLRTILNEAGVQRGGTWLIAEGGDAARLRRSIPIEEVLDDALIAYGQNGEPLRQANGFPVRLLLPGWEGNTNIKWLHRLKVTDGPMMARDETAKYTDPLPGGKARQFSFVMDANSLITSPSYPQRLPGPGWWPITGLAWSGRGRITRVDISVDGGSSWFPAELQEPILPKAHVRFNAMWEWNGRETNIMSRAVDETGYVQPRLAEFRRVRGPGTDFHFNAIKPWTVRPDGSVVFAVGV